jgi:hypothetical protein
MVLSKGSVTPIRLLKHEGRRCLPFLRLFGYSSNGGGQPSSRSSTLVTTIRLRFSGRTRNVLMALFKASCLSAASMTPRCSARLLRMIETCHHAIAYRSPRNRVGGHSGFFGVPQAGAIYHRIYPALRRDQSLQKASPAGCGRRGS